VIESAYTGFHGCDEHTQLYFKDGWLRTQEPALMAKEQPEGVCPIKYNLFSLAWLENSFSRFLCI